MQIIGKLSIYNDIRNITMEMHICTTGCPKSRDHGPAHQARDPGRKHFGLSETDKPALSAGIGPGDAYSIVNSLTNTPVKFPMPFTVTEAVPGPISFVKVRV